MGAIWHIAKKDVRLLLRDRVGMFWLLAFPLIMALFFGAIFGGDMGGSGKGKLRVAVVDLADSTDYAKDFIAGLDSSNAITATQTSSPDSAREWVRLGERHAYVILHQDTTPQTGIDRLTGEIPNIEVGVDPARQAERAFLKGALIQQHFEIIRSRITDVSSIRNLISDELQEIDTVTNLSVANRNLIRLLLRNLDTLIDRATETSLTDSSGALSVLSEGGPFGDPPITETDIARESIGPRTAFEITFPQALMWGLIGCIAAFAISLVLERTHGTLIRLKLAPVSNAHIIGGKALACFLVAISVSVVILGLGNFTFGVRIDEPLKMALAIVANALCFVGLMMFIANLGKTENAVAGAGWGIMLVLMMIGGGMVPLVAMPQWMLNLAGYSPVRWGITALEGAIWRGFSYSEMMMPIIYLISIGLFGFVLGVLLMRRQSA